VHNLVISFDLLWERIHAVGVAALLMRGRLSRVVTDRDLRPGVGVGFLSPVVTDLDERSGVPAGLTLTEGRPLGQSARTDTSKSVDA